MTVAWVPKWGELGEKSVRSQLGYITIENGTPSLVRRKKEKLLRQDEASLCEACEFDFEVVYGDRGKGFIECHPTKPASELKAGEKTRLSDVALVCSN